jgi:hypothetical protein
VGSNPIVSTHNTRSELRWPYIDLDLDEPTIEIAERALEVDDKYVGQATPKTARSRRRIGLHPLLVAALRRPDHGLTH